MAVKRALISVSDKTGVVEMARRAWQRSEREILSTGGTAKALRDAGVEVTDVGGLYRFPGDSRRPGENTASQRSTAACWAARSLPAHVGQMQQHGIRPIDCGRRQSLSLRSDDLQTRLPFEDAIENIDIGGPSMLRSAAKNHEDVFVVVDPADYSRVLDAVKGT